MPNPSIRSLRSEIARHPVFLADSDATLSAMSGSATGRLQKVLQNSSPEERVEALGNIIALTNLLLEHFGISEDDAEFACVKELSKIREFLAR